MRLGLICDGQPGLGACELLAAALQRCGAQATLISATPPQNRALNWLPMNPLEAAASELLHAFAAVGVFVEGETLALVPRIHQQAAALRQRTPVLLFTGPIRPLCGDALHADLLARLDYDLLCLQGDMQLEQRQWLLPGHPQHQQATVTIGLWCLPTAPVGYRPSQQPLLVVLDQPHAPATAVANAVLYTRICSVARQSPNWQILLQPDGPLPADPAQWPDTSLCWHHRQERQPPPNLQVGPPENLAWALAQSTACLGLGSDWLLPAIVWGKTTVVLGDYGIRSEFNGRLFFGSGLMNRLADCLPLDERLQLLRPVNPDWLDRLGWAITDGPQRLLHQLRGQLQQPQHGGALA